MSYRETETLSRSRLHKLALWLGLRAAAPWAGRRLVTHTVPKPVCDGDDGTGPADTLVVYAHPYCPHEPTFDAMRQAVRAAVPAFVDAGGAGPGPVVRLMMPRYPAGPVSNTSPWQVAAELERAIHEASEAGGYRRIVLVGYSAGSLLVRKAVLYGFARTADHPLPESVPRRRRWVERIDRVVLLAGMNRGWSFAERPAHMRRATFILLRLCTLYGRFSRALGFALGGRLIMSLERGEPFVADLRVEWVRLAEELREAMPPVFQLLGGVDDLVSRADNQDVRLSRGFVFLPLPGTGHINVLDFDDSEFGGERLVRLREALAEPVEGLRAAYAGVTRAVGATRDNQIVLDRGEVEDDDHRLTSVTNVVFLVHGIRDNLDWCRAVAARIRARAPGTALVLSSYGYFSMIAFLLLPFRQRNVRWFMDQYSEAVALNPSAPTHFVGHSNGTYLLAAGMRRYHSLRMDRVYFAGSVVPSGFRWDRLYHDGRVRTFRNDRAHADWVVAVFPGFYQLVGHVLPFSFFRDLGDGGFRGFDYSAGPLHTENFYLPGGHGAAVGPGNHDSIADYVVHGTTATPLALRDAGLKTGLGSRLCWVVWLAIAVALAALCSWAATLGATVGAHLGWGEWATAGGLVVFLLLVLVSLATV